MPVVVSVGARRREGGQRLWLDAERRDGDDGRRVGRLRTSVLRRAVRWTPSVVGRRRRRGGFPGRRPGCRRGDGLGRRGKPDGRFRDARNSRDGRGRDALRAVPTTTTGVVGNGTAATGRPRRVGHVRASWGDHDRRGHRQRGARRVGGRPQIRTGGQLVRADQAEAGQGGGAQQGQHGRRGTGGRAWPCPGTSADPRAHGPQYLVVATTHGIWPAREPP